MAVEAIALAFLKSRWGRYLVIGLSVLAGVGVYGRRRSWMGAEKARAKIERNIQSKTGEAIDAYRKVQMDADGCSADDIAKRMRRRDRHWGRLQVLRGRSV